MNEEKNCVIAIEQRKGKSLHTRVYKLNDYRIATAICNILDNVAESKEGLYHNILKIMFMKVNKTSEVK